MAINTKGTQRQAARERVIVYVDGFNLYYGLKSKGWRRYYWIDMRRLAENLLLPGQVLAAVRYFTARISPRPGSTSQSKRQANIPRSAGDPSGPAHPLRPLPRQRETLPGVQS